MQIGHYRFGLIDTGALAGALLLVLANCTAAAAATAADAPAVSPAVSSASAPPHPTDVAGGGLRPFEASYTWDWHGIRVAVSTSRLEHRDGDVWVYTSWATPRGLGRLYAIQPRLQSIMRVTAAGVQPQYFSETGGGARRESLVMFDWVAGRAIGVYEGVRVNLPIKPGIQDDLSVQVAMLVQLLQGVTPTSVLELDRNSVREYAYVREGTARLNTPMGPVDTIIYAAHHPGSPRTTRFWCAPALGYIPMQVQQWRQSDVEWTMRIQSLRRAQG
jgi:Protein of unknown function (DUF3108)